MYVQVSFSQNAPAVMLTSHDVAQLKHVLFACNASMATFKQAWLSLQGTSGLTA